MLLSLTGDYFPAAERARNYARIAAGELVGSGFGFLVSGNVAALLSWRWAFWVLVAPAAGLAFALWRGLPEPPRGGQPERERRGIIQREVQRRAIAPHADRVVGPDAGRMPLRQAVRYVLSVRTNVVLIVAAASANFFFAGVRTFTVVFIRGHYGLTQAAATASMGVLGLGAVAGVLAGGRAADALLGRGRLDARLVVAGTATLAAAGLWIGPLLATAVPLGLAIGLVAAAAMTMPTAPVDAARLDVIPARLRGRAESVRSLLRALAFALAPVAFGLVADAFRGPHAAGAQRAFLVMLAALAAGGLLLLAARRSYPRDLATALAGQRGRSVSREG
jgi:sugar phosphate permease